MTDANATASPAAATDAAAIKQRLRHFSARNLDESAILETLRQRAAFDEELRRRIGRRAVDLVRAIRDQHRPGMMEVFLTEYGLSSEEGVGLMCLAEALLRVPDVDTIDELIEDKIAPSLWSEHLGHSDSALVNASTWALLISGEVLKESSQPGLVGALRGVVKRLGEPMIRSAVKQAMRLLGRQFVLGRTIEEATERAAAAERDGYTYSYDMLGEAALTADDAQHYFDAYRRAIDVLAARSRHDDSRDNPGISVKLSALYPRYERGQRERAVAALSERVLALALRARAANMGLNVDAEEADRLTLSLDVIENVLGDPRLAGWAGFGVVVQAYGRRCGEVIDWLYALATELDRRLMVRLVKGAYWDTEIKRAQVLGVERFPVFTRKSATDVAYLCAARQLLRYADRIYPQFATHNAHTVAAVLELAGPDQRYEFQRLHGMGEALHDEVRSRHDTRCRIYAPVGPHRDLLAYLVRRLLENGANSSFVSQLVDESVAAEEVAADPFETLERRGGAGPGVTPPDALYLPGRRNSRGWDWHDDAHLAAIDDDRERFATRQWRAAPLLATPPAAHHRDELEIINPADAADQVGVVIEASRADVDAALDAAAVWQRGADAATRAAVLRAASDLYEQQCGELFALLAREAGKTLPDAIGELREAVDFLRYYADQCERGEDATAAGRFVCISPWNFPLAIFTGQIAAALAAGNAVLAKPAEATPLVAHLAVTLLHRAGVPPASLQLLPGGGGAVGAALSADPRVDGVCFTGSTATAQKINRAMAQHLDPRAPLIAETGGLNAMIVDSTALPEQAVRDIVVSAFQSAGQRCSALRVLYLQRDIADNVLEMLYGAMDQLVPGRPWALSTDVGPAIDSAARRRIDAHVAAAARDGRLLKQIDVGVFDAAASGHFVGPAVIRVAGVADLAEEVFGPVLHVATFESGQLDQVIDAVNASGYGLTFGLHTRIDGRAADVAARLCVGNVYVNRNQIGAVVGSQPFGGEGLSGTGPKAGGPHYLARFRRTEDSPAAAAAATEPVLDAAAVQRRLDALPAAAAEPFDTVELPGPTGESNRLSRYPRGTLLCLGPDAAAARRQLELAAAYGCAALAVAPGLDDGADALGGYLRRAELTGLDGIDGVLLWGDDNDLRAVRAALAARDGALLPLFADAGAGERLLLERHVCIDTTAAGGNAALLAGAD